MHVELKLGTMPISITVVLSEEQKSVNHFVLQTQQMDKIISVIEQLETITKRVSTKFFRGLSFNRGKLRLIEHIPLLPSYRHRPAHLKR